ncbi:hypothetical protein [Isoptericola sp. BMS4]|uniref:hypothetical protein n=1 Tax=Isoptericola sp. BMS4 TaxID=2527875 RepID=UPI00141E8764|nr:hypothetical protein [Isoptericola sp. BMS4]
MTTADAAIDVRAALAPPPATPRSAEPWPGHRPIVWAPRARTVDVVLPRPDGGADLHPMRLVGAHEPGYWRADEALPTGTDYCYSVDGGSPVPDPCSPSLPAGVHGPSRVVDHSFAWTDARWRGRELDRTALLHLDVATATPEGTLDAATRLLDDVAALGVDGVELAPVAAFDPTQGPASGVRLFAVHEPYGGPHALQRFVDAAHARDLAVVLDVPHRWAVADGLGLHTFGPYASGSRLGPRAGAPAAVRDSPRINLDGSGCRGPRDFLVADAARWFRDFHLDGLLLDVEALLDRSPVPLLGELAEHVRNLEEQLGRRLDLLTDGPGRSDRLVRAVHGLLSEPGRDHVQALRLLSRETFATDGTESTAARLPPSARRARRATRRASSLVVGDLTRLPGATRAAPWSPADDTPSAPEPSATGHDDERACLLAFAVLAGTTTVLDAEHAPVGHDDGPARRLVEWTRRLLALRPTVVAQTGQPLELHVDHHAGSRAGSPALLARRGDTALAVGLGDAPARIDLALLPGHPHQWQPVASWDPDRTRTAAARLVVPDRVPVVLRRQDG